MATERMYTEEEMAQAWENGRAVGYREGYDMHRSGTARTPLPNPYRFEDSDDR